MPMIRRLMCLTAAMLLAVLFALPASAELTPLPMDDLSFGPAPKDENYLDDWTYEDESISVKLGEGRWCDTTYMYAHVKIADPSQLRTVPANVYTSPNAKFTAGSSDANFRGRLVAAKVNAVVALNGDFYTKPNVVKVVLRQGKQVRNKAEGNSDVLIIDKKGDFSYLPLCTQADYEAYYGQHASEMYQAFCFGPVLVRDGKSLIDENYLNKSIGSQNNTQRSAIAQLGELEYLLVVCASNEAYEKDKGLTLYEFAALCEQLGKEQSENGCRLAYNLDGGNSTTLVFKQMDPKENRLKYVKANWPDKERFLGDIIYFATLVK